MTLFLLVLLVTQPAASSAQTVQQCVGYEPNSVALRGRIKRTTFAGPPNYESVAKGDQPERYWVLQLAKPICVSASADSKAEKNVSDIQLVFGDPTNQYRRYKSLLGQRVIVMGTLFQAQTGHHHTRVLLTVRSIKRLKAAHSI